MGQFLMENSWPIFDNFFYMKAIFRVFYHAGLNPTTGKVLLLQTVQRKLAKKAGGKKCILKKKTAQILVIFFSSLLPF